MKYVIVPDTRAAIRVREAGTPDGGRSLLWRVILRLFLGRKGVFSGRMRVRALDGISRSNRGRRRCV
jgi:hypothetical protein